MKNKHQTSSPPSGKLKFVVPFTRKSVLLGIILLVSIFVCIALIWLSQTRQAVAPRGKAKITLTEGSVQKSTDNAQWFDVAPGDILEELVWLRSGRDSRAIVTFANQSEARLDGSSMVRLIRDGADATSLQAIEGNAYHRVGESPKHPYEVSAGSLTVRATGTAFVSRVSAGNVRIEAYHDVVGIVHADSSLSLEPGRYYTLAADGTARTEGLSIEKLKQESFVMWAREMDVRNDLFKDKLGFLTDIISPPLTITTPKNISSTDSSSITVKGTTEKNARLEVNKKAVKFKNEAFTAKVSLDVGANTINVLARDATGNTTVKSLRVIRSAPAPAASPNSIGATTPSPSAGGTSSNSCDSQNQDYIQILSGTRSGNKVTLRWKSGCDVDNSAGYKIRYSTGISYAGAPYVTAGASATSKTFNVPTSDTYFFSICPLSSSNENKCSGSYVL